MSRAPRWVKPGKLRHTVRIEILTTGSPEKLPSGEPNTYWAPYLTRVKAEIDDLRGRELFTAQEHHSEVTTSVKLRYRAGIIADSMRVVHRDAYYYVLTVLEPLHIGRELQLLCKRGVRAT